LAPNDPDLLNMVGYTLADEGTTPAEWREALLLTRRALDLSGGHPVIRDSYGWALFRTGDYRAARRELRQAADGVPDLAEVRYHLGVVYAALGQTREARNEFARALRIQPDHKPTPKGPGRSAARKRLWGGVNASHESRPLS
jgi:Flp pilus assembly protein TadD